MTGMAALLSNLPRRRIANTVLCDARASRSLNPREQPRTYRLHPQPLPDLPHVIVLVDSLDVTIIDAATVEFFGELTLDTGRD